MSWRYLAQRLTRTGPGEFLDLDLPLTDVQITDVLSGPPQLQAKIPVEFTRLRDRNGQPLLREWGCAIYPEASDQIRGGFILVHSGFSPDGSWELEGSGFTGYSNNLPYLDSTYAVEVDPLDRVRHIWEYIQTAHSPLDLVLDGTTSPVRIGTELEQVEFDTQSGPISFEAGPHKLAWWMSHDLQAEVDKLAKETPFEYTEEHSWNEGRTAINHRMRLWYPRKGVRQDRLRFVLGENVFLPPDVTRDGAEFANGALGLGAGEGRDMIRSGIIANPDDDRLSRVAVIADKSLRSVSSANDLARRELAMRLIMDDISELVVQQHPHADINAISVGDEIRVQAETTWIDINSWYRVISTTVSPDTSDSVQLSLLRADRVER